MPRLALPGAAIRDHTIAIKLADRRMAEATVDAGLHLLAVRASMPHGSWLPWLANEFGMHDDAAERMMNVAGRRLGQIPQRCGISRLPCWRCWPLRASRRGGGRGHCRRRSLARHRHHGGRHRGPSPGPLPQVWPHPSQPDSDPRRDRRLLRGQAGARRGARRGKGNGNDRRNGRPHRRGRRSPCRNG